MCLITLHLGVPSKTKWIRVIYSARMQCIAGPILGPETVVSGKTPGMITITKQETHRNPFLLEEQSWNSGIPQSKVPILFALNPWCFEKCHLLYQVAINHRCQGGVKGSATTTFAIHSVCDDRCHSLGDSRNRLEVWGDENVKDRTVYRNMYIHSYIHSLVWWS